jgi:hypothetical protein
MTYENFKIAIIEMAINYGDSVFDIHYSDAQRAIIKAWGNHDCERGSEEFTLLSYTYYCQAKGITIEPELKWVVQIHTNWGHDDQGRRVEWNTFNLHPKPMSEDYKARKNEVIIMASSLGSALDKATAMWCPNGDEIRISATGYIFEE